MSWIAYASFGLSLIIVGFNAALFCVIKFNDLRHLEDSVKNIDKKMDDILQRVSKIEGTCSARKDCK